MIRLSVLVIAMTWPAATGAQEWSVEAHAGRVRAALDPSAAQRQTAMLGLRYDDLTTGFRLSAGIPTGSEVPLWGAMSAGKRLVLRRGVLIAGLDLSAHGFLLHDRAPHIREIRNIFGRQIGQTVESISGFAVAGQAMPGVGLELGRVQAQARWGISQYTSRLGDREIDRTVTLGDAQLTVTPAAPVAMTVAVRRFEADDSAFTYAGVTALAAHGRASVWGTIGQWIDTESDLLPWAAGASIRVQDRTTLTLSARNDALDPLYLAPPQTAWSIGATVRLGARATPAAPVPAAYADGQATIRLPRSQSSGAPRIAGDFNQWKPQMMQRTGDSWAYTARISPGVYNYAFVNERGEWFVPEKHPGRKADGMGGYVAVLVVQ